MDSGGLNSEFAQQAPFTPCVYEWDVDIYLLAEAAVAKLYVRAEVSAGLLAGEPGQQEKAHKAINTDIYGKLLHGTISQDIYGKLSQGGIWLVNHISAGLLGMLVQLPIL